MSSSSSSRVEIAYGKYAGSVLDAPQRFDLIKNATDKSNAAVVFGAVMAYYQEVGKSILLLEVDEFVERQSMPYWRLCVYGLAEEPTREDIRRLTADMEPVRPLSIVFEPSRQSQTLFRDEFLTHALCIMMATVTSSSIPLSRTPDIVQMISKTNVETWPTMRQASVVSVDAKRAGITSTILRRKTATSEKRSREDKLSKARERFQKRTLLETWADYVAGVKWEDVERQIETEELSELDGHDLH